MSRNSADPKKIAKAVRELLLASGLDPERGDFIGTPDRVARLWQSEILSGYEADEAKILSDFVEGEGQTELVVIRDLPCHGMCPHHLMPWVGTATVAYLPADRLIGFGRLNELVHCYTRRLTLQERACNDISDALMRGLGARGSACVITGAHNCLNIPGDKHGARVLTSSYRGELRSRIDLQIQLTQ